MPDVDVTSLILRFRDLVTERGHTIQRHKTIAEDPQAGYVWWGWWHKLEETIPGAAFRYLAQQAESGGLDVYLFDSGQETLYKAHCVGIHWHNRHNEVRSPDPTKTPEYYNQQHYLAWFKLTDIIEVDDSNEVLRQFTYVRVNEFFRSHLSKYTPFYEKRVYSVGELRQQDRTIWFVRGFRQGDATHEVSLLEAEAITPQNFARQYVETTSSSLLWVSDLHFSKEGHHAFPLESDPVQFNVGHQIEQAFKDETNGIGGLIISGDMTWKALPEEFEMTKEFIRRVNVWSPVRSPQIAVCPGNHDLAFSANPADKKARITEVGDPSRAAYRRFYEDVFYIAPNEYLSCGKRFLLGKALPVDIVCLNSSYLQQHKRLFQGHGFIGDKQLQDAAAEMGWQTDASHTRAIRIVVVHHHILPVTFRDEPVGGYPYSVVLDAEALVRWLVEHRVDVVLHGHMHQPYAAKISRPISTTAPNKGWHDFYVLGLGSSGAKGHKGEFGHNTVTLLRFEKDKLNVLMKTIHPINPAGEGWEFDVPLRV